MGGQAKTGQLEHLPALDGLRGLAILLVLPHNLRRITEPFDAVSLGWVKLGDMGWIGVQLFFVLSGFLITRILLSTQTASNYYSGFYARRTLRILPLYYFTMIVWLGVLLTFGLGVLPERLFDWSQWVFLSNWTQPFYATGNGLAHFWSLAVEEQFYLVWPLVVRLVMKRSSALGVLRLCGLVAMTSLGIRVVMLATGWPSETVYEFTICRMDALAMGGAVAAALVVPGLKEKLLPWAVALRWAPLTIFVVGAALSRGYRQTGAMAQTAGYTLLAAAFALWVLSIALAKADEHVALRTRAMRTFGKYSYALYVFHFPLAMARESVFAQLGGLGRMSVAMDVASVVASAAVVFGLAMLSYRFLEAPILRWQSQFEASFN